MKPRNIKIKRDPVRKCQYSKLNDGRLQIHQDYGLWICSWIKENKVPAHKVPKPRYFQCFAISQIIKGKGWLWTEEEGKKFFSAGEAIIVFPDMLQDYNGVGSYYLEDSVCFTGPIADSLVKSGILRPGIFKVGSLRRLLPIIELAENPAKDAQIKANIELQHYLVNIYLENQQRNTTNKTEIVDKMLKQIIAAPENKWAAEMMADMCNLSKSHFSRVFKERTGITPKAYVDRLKMEAAAEQLTTTQKSIADIAIYFGFNDQFHFSRRFKEVKGVSPLVFRNSQR